MSSVAFDTLKLAQRLEAAGFPTKQARDMASAATIGNAVATRTYIDLRLAELKVETLKWMFTAALCLQLLVILGGVAALLPLVR